jgi:ParB family chromosome partitioning protein
LRAGQYQPRRVMDEGALYELAESIRTQGVMQPLLVRPIGESGYEIIAGERRFRASQLAGLDEVPVLVREVDDQQAAIMALVENMQREDLNPLEEARGLQRLVQEFGFTHEQAAQAVGRSRSAATNLLRLLQLSQQVQQMLMAGDLDMGHARALLPLDGARQVLVAQEVASKKLSVREAERLAARALKPEKPAPATASRQATATETSPVSKRPWPTGWQPLWRFVFCAAPRAAKRERCPSASARSKNSTACCSAWACPRREPLTPCDFVRSLKPF